MAPCCEGRLHLRPGGTIHAIGAGIVLAEIQQRSDTTFRLFDFGRHRELHEDDAVAASDAGPSQAQSAPRRLTDARRILVASPQFVLERVDFQANSQWALDANRETWMLVIEGKARIGHTDATVGDAIFIEADSAGIAIGLDGMSGLVAYPGPDPMVSLLQDCTGRATKSPDASTGTGSRKSGKIIEAQT
ncbi:hypothetical protein [Bradyrhizobium japonicum]|uniref:hypothetical protein n=1 Tax=Bradyrhizobium japonicum TaxID=375 RepID=UPI00200F1939|nr:hypothetical protein [Bradyrhizobium japonicum]